MAKTLGKRKRELHLSIKITATGRGYDFICNTLETTLKAYVGTIPGIHSVDATFYRDEIPAVKEKK